MLAFLAKGKRKIGYDSMQELSGIFYNEKIPEDMGKHAVDRYLDFPRYLGFKGDKAEFKIYPGAENERQVEDSCSGIIRLTGRSGDCRQPPGPLGYETLGQSEICRCFATGSAAELGMKIMFHRERRGGNDCRYHCENEDGGR